MTGRNSASLRYPPFGWKVSQDGGRRCRTLCSCARQVLKGPTCRGQLCAYNLERISDLLVRGLAEDDHIIQDIQDGQHSACTGTCVKTPVESVSAYGDNFPVMCVMGCTGAGQGTASGCLRLPPLLLRNAAEE